MFMSIKQVSDRWGVSYDLVYAMTTKGELEAFKVGGLWRISKSAVDAYEAEHTNTKKARAVRAPVMRL